MISVNRVWPSISSDQQNSGCILDFSLSFEFYFSFSLVLTERTNMIMINLGPTWCICLFFPFWFAEKFCLSKGNLSIIVCFGWQTPKMYDVRWNREWTRLVKKAEDWYHMDCKWQTLKLLAKFIKNLKLWRSSFNVFFLKQVKCEKQILTGELYFDKWHFGKVEKKSLKNFRLLRDLNPRLVSAYWLRNPTGLHSHMLRARKNISGSLKQVTLSSFFLYRCFYSFFFFK